MFSLIYLLSEYFFPLLVVALIVFLIVRANHRSRAVAEADTASANNATASVASHSDYHMAVSKEDAWSQIFIVFTLILFGLMLAMLNWYLGKPIGGGGIVLIILLAALGIAYYFRMLAIAVIALLGIYFWWGFQGMEWMRASHASLAVVIAGSLLLSLLYCALGYAHRGSERFKRLSSVYLTFGSISLTFVLIGYSMESGLESLFNAPGAADRVASWQLAVSLFVGVIGFIMALAYANFKKTITMVETVASLCFAGVAIGMIFLKGAMHETAPSLLYGSASPVMVVSDKLSLAGRAWAIIMNLALILEVLVLLFLGYMRQKAAFVNLGAVALFVLLFIKYIDWFYDSLDKEFFFIGAGVLLLLIGGAMEKGRRFVLARMQA